MEFFACVFGGTLLIGCGLSLFLVRAPDWRSDADISTEEDRMHARWSTFQRVIRYCNNVMVTLIGAAILATAFVPRGRWWVFLWSAILVMLLLCILFAMIDAMTSLAGYRRALPEAARRSLGGDHDS